MSDAPTTSLPPKSLTAPEVARSTAAHRLWCQFQWVLLAKETSLWIYWRSSWASRFSCSIWCNIQLTFNLKVLVENKLEKKSVNKQTRTRIPQNSKQTNHLSQIRFCGKLVSRKRLKNFSQIMFFRFQSMSFYWGLWPKSLYHMSLPGSWQLWCLKPNHIK